MKSIQVISYQSYLTSQSQQTTVQTMVYQKVDREYIRYIGNDYLGALDENGHTTISADEKWVHMNGQLVCYEANQVKSTDERRN